MTTPGDEPEKKRPRLPPSLKDIVYVAVISAPSPGKNSNFEVLAISMSDFSIIRLKYSRKTRLSPGTVIDLRDFGELTHYSIDDNIPPETLGARERSYIGKALIAAGKRHPIGLIKSQTMPLEGIKNLFVLLNMTDAERIEVFYEELRKASFNETIVHRDIFGIFVRAFSGCRNPPDISQQEALISICGNSPGVIAELSEGFLEYLREE